MSQIDELSYHKIYEEFPYIEHEVSNLIYIPLFNKRNQVIAYSLSNLSLKDKLLTYRYHLSKCECKSIKYYAVSNMNISMHEIVTNSKALDGYVIDHINSDGLDNTEKNLLHVTRNANAQNKEKKKNAVSKYIGVTLSQNRWVARINHNGEKEYLGTFKNEIDAAKIYDVYATYYYKESSPSTNNLLTELEIITIKNNGIPKEYIKEKKERDLPKNIRLRNRLYNIEVTYNKKCYRKTAETLEDAITIRSQIYDEIENLKPKLSKSIVRNNDGIAIIYMSNGAECIVEEDHWEELNKYKWTYINYENKSTYPMADVNGKHKLLHRYVYEKYVGEIPPKMTVDHVISKNILDVRLKNLRLADMSLQNHNKNKVNNNIDKYRGVYFTGSSFRVDINDKYYGYYDTAEKAAEKANEIYRLIYGDNANLNNIDH